MKPVNALLIGTGLMIAVYYGRRLASIVNGDVTAVPVGFSNFKLNGGYVESAILVKIINNGSVSFNVKAIRGTVYVDSKPLIDVNAIDPFTIQPKASQEIAIELSVAATAGAALTIVQLVTGILSKRVSLTFDGWIEAEGLTLPIKKTFSYGA